ncbi:MAG: PBP1A family penicillin-binding protein [Anaerolineae bacterium]|nr:PBP1A family penicillin-binding protein [Anaerolineae bacterium]
MEHLPADRKKSPRAQLASHHIPYYARLRRRRYVERHDNHGWLNFALGALFIFTVACAATIGVSFAALAAGYAYIVSLLPAQIELGPIRADQSTKIYDRYGALLFEIFDPQGGRRTIVAPENIPTYLKQAVIATEDPSFYDNPGVDVEGLARAMYYMWRDRGPSVGGSTITQQLVKNTMLTPEVTLTRKLREAVYALELSRRYTKEQILAMYLNQINFGNLSYGVQAAARSYFDKDVGELTLTEATLLAGLPQSPAVYDPCRNPEAARVRQNIVLNSMVREGYITRYDARTVNEETAALLHSEKFLENCTAGIAQAYPHFVEYAREQLELKYGPELVYRGGLRVYTSIDPQIQRIAEQEARKQIELIREKNVHSAAVVVTNPQTGEIYAMVGSVNFYDQTIDGQVNVANRLRQPGSSIKPLNYVTALEKGWTLATPILDRKIEFSGFPTTYIPVNYDGKEHGIVSVRAALANSYNIPAIKTLHYVTVPRLVASAQRFGISTFDDPSHYGLALTLGGGDVKLVELTGAYAVFANEGKRVPLTPINRILDGQGNVIFDIQSHKQAAQTVVDPRYAYLITSVLSDNQARTPAFGQNSPLKLCVDGASTCTADKIRPAAVKTGTTNDFRDNWTMGYTPELVVGVWVGNPRNEEMKNVTGISGAAPIWHNIMARVYAEREPFKSVAPHPFRIPTGLVQASVCRETGLLATSGCADRTNEIFLAEEVPGAVDNSRVPVSIDKTNGLLAGPGCPAEIVETRYYNRSPQADIRMAVGKIDDWLKSHPAAQMPTAASPCAQTHGTSASADRQQP